MAASPPGPESSEPRAGVASARRSRFLGSQYADVTKLRELSARHQHRAARIHQRISRLNTRIEKLRHQATLLREKAVHQAERRPELEQEVKQQTRDLERAQTGQAPGTLRSDVTGQRYRLRKLQQKVEDLNSRVRSLELRAAQRTQKASELKVKGDQWLEAARLEEEEAARYQQRADRLQSLTDQEAAGPTGTAAAPPPPPPPSPGAP